MSCSFIGSRENPCPGCFFQTDVILVRKQAVAAGKERVVLIQWFCFERIRGCLYRLLPEAGSGNRRIFRKNGPCAGGPDKTDAFHDLLCRLPGKAAQEVDPDVARIISCSRKGLDGFHEIPVFGLSSHNNLGRFIRCLETETNGFDACLKEETRYFVRDFPKVQAIGTVEAAVHIPADDLLEKRDGNLPRATEKGVVVKGKVPDSEGPIPERDLLRDEEGISSPEARAQKMGSTVCAAERTPARGQDGNLIKSGKKVKRRMRKGIEMTGIGNVPEIRMEQTAQKARQFSFSFTRKNVIGAAMQSRMLCAQRRINTAENDRNARPDPADDPYRICNSRIPVSHHARDENNIRFFCSAYRFFEQASRNAVPMIGFGKRFEGFRPVYFFLSKFSASIRMPFWKRGDGLVPERRVMGIQTIDQANGKAVFPQHRREGQKPEGLDPEIEGGKIMDPWVDKKGNFLTIHGRYLHCEIAE